MHSMFESVSFVTQYSLPAESSPAYLLVLGSTFPSTVAGSSAAAVLTRSKIEDPRLRHRFRAWHARSEKEYSTQNEFCCGEAPHALTIDRANPQVQNMARGFAKRRHRRLVVSGRSVWDDISAFGAPLVTPFELRDAEASIAVELRC